MTNTGNELPWDVNAAVSEMTILTKDTTEALENETNLLALGQMAEFYDASGKKKQINARYVRAAAEFKKRWPQLQTARKESINRLLDAQNQLKAATIINMRFLEPLRPHRSKD